jgi:hypothetical protein
VSLKNPRALVVLRSLEPKILWIFVDGLRPTLLESQARG